MIRTRAGAPLTVHALQSMLARDVTPDEVDRVLSLPDQQYCSPGRDGQRGTVHQRGDIAVVTGSDGVVVTVLYRTEGPGRWTSEQGRPSGRRMSGLARRKLAAQLRRAMGRTA